MSDSSVLMAQAAFACLGAGLLLLSLAGTAAIRADSSRRGWFLASRWRFVSDVSMVAGGVAMIASWTLLGVSVLWWKP